MRKSWTTHFHPPGHRSGPVVDDWVQRETGIRMKVQRITSAAIHNRCAHAGLRPSSLRAGWRLAMDSLIAIVVGGLTYDDGNGMTSACSQTAFLAWAWELGQSVSSPGFFPGLSHPQPLLFKQLALLQ